MSYDGSVTKFVCVSLLLFGLLTGCVERKLSIKTDPPGARTYVDYDLKGQTPVEVNFTHYGSRFVRLEKSGYRTKLATIDFTTPWYSYFPINFFTEVLYPYTILDHRERHYELKGDVLPANQDRSEQELERKKIQQRAESLRKQAPGSSSTSSSED